MIVPRVLPPPPLESLIAGDPSLLMSGLANPAVLAFAQQRAGKHYHWHKLRRIASDAGIDPHEAWAVARFGRLSQSRTLPLHGDGSSPIVFVPTGCIQLECMRIDQELASGIPGGVDRGMGTDARARFVVSSLMDEAIASSQIEGASTLHRVAKRMLQEGRPPRNRSEQMIVNNYRTMIMIRERRSEAMTPELLLEIQQTLTDGTLDHADQQGRFRTIADMVEVVSNRDGEVIHTPPPANELRARLGRLCTFANQLAENGDNFIHPIVKAIALHFQIGFDHPFCDGNGRTARALFYWSALRDRYELIEFLPISRMILEAPGKYVRAYQETETDGFDLTYFLHFHLDIISRAREDFRARAAEKQRQIERQEALIGSEIGINYRQRTLLQAASEQPDRVFTIQGHQGSHMVAYATARADLLDLVERGLLEQRSVGKRFVFNPSKRLISMLRP